MALNTKKDKDIHEIGKRMAKDKHFDLFMQL